MPFLTCGVLFFLLLSGTSYAGNKITPQNIKESKISESGKNADETDYSGIYKSADAESCRIFITIKKAKSGYIYAIDGTGARSTGKLSIVKDASETYLVFTGTKRDGDKAAIEGVWAGRIITIQNYGDSISRYICFKNCDGKFIELIKAD
jgi:hypothetical protein